MTTLQTRISSIFDFAYTSTAIRVPATTCREVGKILHAGMFREEVEKRVPAFSISTTELRKLNGNESDASLQIAKDTKALFTMMNANWKLYKEPILFDNHEIAYIVGQLNDLYISDPSKDVFGDALEIFRSR